MIGTVLRTGSQSHFTYHTLHCIRRLALLTNRSAVQASKLPALLHGMASSCLSTPKHSKAGNALLAEFVVVALAQTAVNRAIIRESKASTAQKLKRFIEKIIIMLL